MSPNLPLPNYRMIIANPPICQNQQQQFQQHQQQGMNLLNYSIPALSNGTNPYVPPAVEQKPLKKAQKQEHGDHGPGKSWKVLEFFSCPGKSWNVLELY